MGTFCKTQEGVRCTYRNKRRISQEIPIVPRSRIGQQSENGSERGQGEKSCQNIFTVY